MRTIGAAILLASIAFAVQGQDTPPRAEDIFAPNVIVQSEESIPTPELDMDALSGECGDVTTSDVEYAFWAQAGWVLDRRGTSLTWCSLIDGSRSVPLPNGYVWDDGYLGARISSDGTYLAFFGSRAEQPAELPREHTLTAFIYEFSLNEIRALGDFQIGGNRTYFQQLTPDYVLMATGESPVAYSMALYIADVAVPGSLRFLTRESNAFPGFVIMGDPPRLVSTELCFRVEIDLATGVETPLDPDGLCKPDYITSGGIAYYRAAPTGYAMDCCRYNYIPVPTAPIVRYDPASGTQTTLFDGEVEMIRWASEDGRYALFLMDDSGMIDRYPYLTVWDLEYDTPQHPQWVLYDLSVPRALLRTDASLAEQDIDLTSRNAIWQEIVPLSEHNLLRIGCSTATFDCESASAFMVSLDNGQVAETQAFTNVVATVNAGRFLLIEQEGLNVVDPYTGDVRPFITAEPLREFSITIGWDEGEARYLLQASRPSCGSGCVGYFTVSFYEGLRIIVNE